MFLLNRCGVLENPGEKAEQIKRELESMPGVSRAQVKPSADEFGPYEYTADIKLKSGGRLLVYFPGVREKADATAEFVVFSLGPYTFQFAGCKTSDADRGRPFYHSALLFGRKGYYRALFKNRYNRVSELIAAYDEILTTLKTWPHCPLYGVSRLPEKLASLYLRLTK